MPSRAKFLLAICFALICSTAALAQGYSVRVVHNTNLRATHSLDARIVDTAPAGTTLGVTGNQGDWLHIDWKGRAVWMADWVPMTRIAAPTSTAPNVNNCCFIDRQCASDAEWVDGYWAFQKNQCGAPTQSAATSSQQPTSETATDQNNCCFTGWQCHSDLDWVAGFVAFQQNRCEHRGMAIEGPDSFVAKLQNALDLIQARSSHWYGYIISGLSAVRVTTEVTYSGVNIATSTWRMPPHRAERTTARWIYSLAHEACHVHRVRSGQSGDALTEERACVTAGRDAVLAVGPPGAPGLIARQNKILANIDRTECQWWHDPANYRFPDDCLR